MASAETSRAADSALPGAASGALLRAHYAAAALHTAVLADVLAAALLLSAAFMVALACWSSAKDTDIKVWPALVTGVVLIAALAAGRYLHGPLGAYGPASWVTAALGVGAVTLATAGFLRIKSATEEKKEAASEVWQVVLFAMGAVACISVAGHSFGLISGARTLDAEVGPISMSPLLRSWSEAGEAFVVSAAFLVPILLVAVLTLRHFGALALRGLRQAGLHLLIGALLIAGPAAGQYFYTVQQAQQAAAALSGCTDQEVESKELTLTRMVGQPARPECESPAVAVTRSQVVIRQKERGPVEQLDRAEACEQLSADLEVKAKGDFFVALDAATPYRRWRCLAHALQSDKVLQKKTALYKAMAPETAGRQGVLLGYLAKGDIGDVSKARVPFDEIRPFRAAIVLWGPVEGSWDQHLMHVHLTGSSAKLQKGPNQKARSFSGSLYEIAEALGKALRGAPFGITAEEHVPAATILTVAQLTRHGPTLWLNQPGEAKKLEDQPFDDKKAGDGEKADGGEQADDDKPASKPEPAQPEAPKPEAK